jgi:hypothetical protein
MIREIREISEKNFASFAQHFACFALKSQHALR